MLMGGHQLPSQLKIILGTDVFQMKLMTLFPLPGVVATMSLTAAFGKGTEQDTSSVNISRELGRQLAVFTIALGWEPGSCQCTA